MKAPLSWCVTALAVLGLLIPDAALARGGGGSRGGRSSGSYSVPKSSTPKTYRAPRTYRAPSTTYRSPSRSYLSSKSFKTPRYKSVSTARTYKAPPPRTPRAWAGGGTRVISGSVRVHDGDTFYAEGRRIRVRGIDTPELGHARSFAARERLNQLLRSGTVTVEPRAIDKYGRTVATVRVNGQDVAQILKAEGYAK